MAKRPKRRRLNPDAVIEYGVKLQIETAERTLSPKEVGRLLGVTGEAVKHWIVNGQLPAIKRPNGYWRVKVSELERFITRRNQAGPKHAIIAVSPPGQNVAELVLESLGFLPLTALSLADALLKAQDTCALLFIIDFNWPEAVRLIEEIRARRAIQYAQILLLCERSLRADELEWALNVKVCGCMVAPITIVALKNELQFFLRPDL